MSLEKLEFLVVEKDYGSQLRPLVQRLMTGPGAQDTGSALRMPQHPTGGHRDQRPGLGRNDRR